MRVWRICKQRHQGTAFSGEGARLAGGRWNSPGMAMVYTSWCLSLAALEVFVNLEVAQAPEDLVSFCAEVPAEDAWAQRGEAAALLPAGWRRANDAGAKRFGDEWVRAGTSLALAVPSPVIEGEWNVLLNPGHEDAARVKVVKMNPFRFDGRMFR